MGKLGEYYWVMEYFKVLLAYLILVFVYPSVLFRNYLKGKGRTFWFGFCVTASLMLVNTAVIVLGLLHLLNVWVIRILFYGSLLLSLSRSIRLPMTVRYLVYKMQNRTYGNKLLVAQSWESISGTLRRGFSSLWRILRDNFLEILVLLGLVIYGMLYFSWNPLHTQGYGFSDIIVHHYWTYGLQQGKIFVAGIYPEGMHCMAYAMSNLFGIDLYGVILYIQCANIIAFLVSIYLFGREIGGWKGSALAMLAAFLTIKLDTMAEIVTMARLQSALPQDYGLYTVFLIPTFLMRYLKNASQVTVRGKKTRFYWDENLVVFTLGIAASIAIHFYATIMAVFSCLGVIVVWLFKIIHWRRLVPLALSAVLALVLSFGPMMLAYASGINFQGSIFWALNVMKSQKTEDQVDETETPTTAADELMNSLPDSTEPLSTESISPAATESVVPTAAQPVVPVIELSLGEKLTRLGQSVDRRIQKIIDGIYINSYQGLYAPEGVRAFVTISICAVCLAVAYRLLILLLRRVFPKIRFPMELFDGYAILVVITLVFMMAFSPTSTGFPKLIAPDRVCSAAHGFLMCLLILPLDLAGILLGKLLNKGIMSLISAGTVAAVFYLVITGGYYHGYLFIHGTRHNAAVNVTNSILRDTPKDHFTVVSTTDELYQIKGNGFHEEILTFQRSISKQEYYIPTRYLFFFLEKHPIRYVQYHFNDGPAWLAQQRYSGIFGSVSVGDGMIGGEISDEIAKKNLILSGKLSDAYNSLYNREILESRMAIYLRQFEKEYPNELNVYYEDEDFICYCLEQNPNRLFNLGMRS